MKYSYLLAFSDSLGTQDEVKKCLETIPGIIWRYDMPNAFYIVSEESANEIYKRISAYFKNDGRFIITEIASSNKQGWLTKRSWFIINDKKMPK